MDIKQLARIDLNLLISLQVLLEEQNVSRAAERLFITQPAMSKTLSRLRQVFDDPLFTRTSHGMQATPRALQVQVELESVLRNIQHLVSNQSFDPTSFQGEITVALTETIGLSLLPPLMARLQGSAAGLSVRTITRLENQLEQLAGGNLDLAIHVRHADYREDFICHSLGSFTPVLLGRQGHPLGGQPVTWERIARYPLIRMYLPDLEQLHMFRSRQRFIQIGYQQAVSFETTHLLTALEVLRKTDSLMPATPLLLRNPAASHKIQGLPFPEEVDYQVEYLLVRHCRTEKSPLHNWLWQEIIDLLDTLYAPDTADMAYYPLSQSGESASQ